MLSEKKKRKRKTWIKKKVKLSHYGPEQGHRVPGGYGPQIS